MAAAAEAPQKERAKCSECDENPATVQCGKCEIKFCAKCACDAEIHVRSRQAHLRVPIQMICATHNEELHAYCAREKRLVCAQCVPATCEGHATAVLTISDAAAGRRKDAEHVCATLASNTTSVQQETGRLEALRRAIDMRIGQLAKVERHTGTPHHNLKRVLTLDDRHFMASADAEIEHADTEMDTATGLVRDGEVELQRMCDGVATLASKFKSHKCIPRDTTLQVPNLAALAEARAIASFPAFAGHPARICDVGNGSYIVADYNPGNLNVGQAWQVFPDGTQPPQPAASAGMSVMTVLSIDERKGGGHLILLHGHSRVDRTGSLAWQMGVPGSPWAAIVLGDTVLVTTTSGQVVRLDLRNGANRGTAQIAQPRGIAQHPTTGQIFVLTDGNPKTVAVLNAADLKLQSTLVLAGVRNAYDLHIAGDGRLYIVDYGTRAVLVVDSSTGRQLARFPVPGSPRGVTVTHTGAIMVSHFDTPGISLIDS